MFMLSQIHLKSQHIYIDLNLSCSSWLVLISNYESNYSDPSELNIYATAWSP